MTFLDFIAKEFEVFHSGDKSLNVVHQMGPIKSVS